MARTEVKLFFPEKVTEPTDSVLFSGKNSLSEVRLFFSGKNVLTRTRSGCIVRYGMTAKNTPYLLESVCEILLTVLYTSAVRDAVPVSLLLVAESGTAKSKLLEALTSDTIHRTDSFTSTGLFDIMKQDNANKLKWIVTPDLNPTLSRRQATVTSTVANLLSLTMDGTCRVDDGRAEKVAKHVPIGLLSGITPDIYNKQTKRWLALGLRRRIIPIFYQYTQATTEALKKHVREDNISQAEFPKIHFNTNGTSKKPVIHEKEAYILEAFGTQFAANLGTSKFKDSEGHVKWYVHNIVPISPIVTLRTIARAHALKENRAEVNDSDLRFIAGFMDFTNPSVPKQI